MRVFGVGEAVTQAAMREEETQSWRELTPSASARFHQERPAALLQINTGSHTSRRGGPADVLRAGTPTTLYQHPVSVRHRRAVKIFLSHAHTSQKKYALVTHVADLVSKKMYTKHFGAKVSSVND